MGRTLITFLGLVSASILPTVSLIMGSMTANGRSVSALKALRAELAAAVDALFFILGLVGLIVFTLVVRSLQMPDVLRAIPYVHAIIVRGSQAFVVGCTAMTLLCATQIPAILRRSLDIRYQIAVDEARRKTSENAPPPGEMAKHFSTDPEFGKSFPLRSQNTSDQE
ncbi:hypothetical protein [Komagataeibacter xylinus]|uniref:hypothetical protein n=1 Tax=Komagataeibacter xylinus TaxID=28448 RepID=UPI00280A5F92|nr:hypothetical protein [Komagataeibacter xylinus]